MKDFLIIRTFLGVIFGILLAVNGAPITTWQYWVLISLYTVNGLICAMDAERKLQ